MSKELKALRNYKDIKDYYHLKAKRAYSTLRIFEMEDDYYQIVETALKDFEYLKSLVSIDWFDKLSPDDKIKVLKIMGLEIEFNE